jgi:cyanoexosortase B-associated protein
MLDAVKPIAKRKPVVWWVLIALLAAVVAVSAIPSYFSGQWPWNSMLKVPQLAQLQALKEAPLPLPGWEITLQQAVNIGGDTWNLAEYQAAAPPNRDVPSFALLLKPQTYHDKQPEVEWVDITGSQSWQVDDLHAVHFSQLGQTQSTSTVTARYFRGLDDKTLAVMQWYAWPSGGHYAPGNWFWADQLRQWRHKERLPWVSVSILVPIEPVGNIRSHTEAVVAIAQSVQASLQTAAFQDTQ